MYETKIILDSLAPSGGRLTTFQLTLPRIVLAELNTHRMFSRNSASSRAIPVDKMIERVEGDPFVPSYLGANQRGMQAETELDEEDQSDALEFWQEAMSDALHWAKQLKDVGLHKQLTNRLLEPFMWHTVVCTATEYENFFALRDNPQAAPEIRESAHSAQELYRKSEPRKVESGGWHLPYVTGFDDEIPPLKTGDAVFDAGLVDTVARHIAVSVGRCAAVTYLNQERRSDAAGDADRARRLNGSGHMSPFEHVARSLTRDQWVDYATRMCWGWVHDRIPVGNLWGWHQYRKSIAGEHDFSKVSR